ncbi:MAG: hypothetical protein JWP35_319 [Caulobacter sp.]|nr:hypothetical protein [Caulobacter sp.]
MQRTRWWALGGAALVLLLIVQMLRYDLHGSSRFAYRLDRLTGRVAICGGSECTTLPETKGKPFHVEDLLNGTASPPNLTDGGLPLPTPEAPR